MLAFAIAPIRVTVAELELLDQGVQFDVRRDLPPRVVPDRLCFGLLLDKVLKPLRLLLLLLLLQPTLLLMAICRRTRIMHNTGLVRTRNTLLNSSRLHRQMLRLLAAVAGLLHSLSLLALLVLLHLLCSSFPSMQLLLFTWCCCCCC